MRRRMKLFPMLVAAFVMIACTIITLNRLDTDIAALEDVARETKLRQLNLESEQSQMRQELAMKDTDSYIMEKARTLYGYLMPGEIRFEVSNPDSLFDTPEAIVVGEGE